MSNILFNKVFFKLNQTHNQGGENRAFASAPKFSGIISDCIKKVMLIFGFSESPWTNYWLHLLQTELLVSPCFGLFTTTVLIECSLYSLRVKIAYLDIKSKLANHRFVNILAFESAIQVLNGLAANVRNPAPAVKIIRVRCVTHETSFHAINCDWFTWCGSLLWLSYYCWMMSASLNHCKKMGAEPGRRFLKRPAAKLEPVIVVYVYW